MLLVVFLPMELVHKTVWICFDLEMRAFLPAAKGDHCLASAAGGAGHLFVPTSPSCPMYEWESGWDSPPHLPACA